LNNPQPLQYYEREFLRSEGIARHQRVVSIPAHRGMITDRNGKPLAIRSPINSVWVNPKEVLCAKVPLANLAKVLDLNERELLQRLGQYSLKNLEQDIRALVEPTAQVDPKLRSPFAYTRFTARGLRKALLDEKGSVR
jgi:cell division protein FtsI (penicillin-binding protein 3)